MKQKDYELLEGLYKDNINIHIKSALKKAIKLLKADSIPVEAPVKPESENKEEYLIANLMENIRHSFDGADKVIKFSITAKCKYSTRTISNE